MSDRGEITEDPQEVLAEDLESQGSKEESPESGEPEQQLEVLSEKAEPEEGAEPTDSAVEADDASETAASSEADAAEPGDSETEEESEHAEDAEVAAFAEGLSPDEAAKFLELVGIGRAKRKAKVEAKKQESSPADSPIKNPFAGLALVEKLEANRPKKRFGLKAKAKDDVHAKAVEPEQPKIEALDTSIIKSEQKPKKIPGGDLKALEEELAKSSPGKLSGGFKRRASGMIQFLGALEQTERAAILVRNEDRVLEAVAVSGFSAEDFFSQTSRRLLKYTQLTKQPLMVIDCAKDNRFARDPEIVSNKVRAVICVPFTDFLTESEGLIYLDNTTEPNAFSYEDLKKVEAFAELVETEADLGIHEFQPPAEPEELQTEVEPTSPWVPVVVLAASLLFIIPAIWSKAKPALAPAPVSTPKIVTAETSTPEQVVLSYLRALGSGAPEGAYFYLSENVKGQTTLASFEQAMDLYLSENERAFALMRAQTSSVEVSGNRAVVTIEIDPDLAPWLATLEKDEEVWHIAALEGGPQFKIADN